MVLYEWHWQIKWIYTHQVVRLVFGTSGSPWNTTLSCAKQSFRLHWSVNNVNHQFFKWTPMITRDKKPSVNNWLLLLFLHLNWAFVPSIAILKLFREEWNHVCYLHLFNKLWTSTVNPHTATWRQFYPIVDFHAKLLNRKIYSKFI